MIVIPLKRSLPANPDVEAGFQVTGETVAVNCLAPTGIY